MLSDHEGYNNGKHGYKSRKSSAVWTHFKLISEERAVICLHCKRKLKCSASRSTTPMHVHLRRRHPFLLPLASKKQLHDARDASESKQPVLHLEKSSYYHFRKEPSQLLKLQVEKLQRRLNEKDTEVTKTYETFQQTIQALKKTMKVMQERLSQQTGKHQVVNQSTPVSPVQTSSQEPTAASSQHAWQLSSEPKEEKMPGYGEDEDTEEKMPGYGEDEDTEEKMPGYGEDEDTEDYEGDSDEILDSNPQIDLDYLLQDNSNCGKNPENQALQPSRSDHSTLSSTDNKARELYSCTWCGERFTKEYYVKLHRLIHDKEATLDQCLSEPMKYVRVIKPYECDVCGMGLNTADALHVHQRLHNEKNGRCERDAKGRKLYKCGWCDKSFTDSTFFCVHQGVHLGERPFVCSWCKATFIYPTSLRRHQKCHCKSRPTQDLSLSPSRSYLCDCCGKAFQSWYRLKRHAMLHTGEKPYKCTVCDKRFRLKSCLKQHSLNHSEDRPYKCRICDKGFTRLQFAKKHERVHTKEKPYCCFFCGKVFGYQESLYVHQKRFHSVTGC